MEEQLFTSESVTEGHPDKMCDQIADAVLDACLREDPHSRVACEALTTTGLVVLAGEITTSANLDFQTIVRDTIKQIGYDRSELGFDYRTCGVLVAIGKQSPDIAQGVDVGRGLHEEQGAGDQGMMFGFACDETPQLMPMPIFLAHRLTERLAEMRRSGELPYLGPDGKSQVTLRYAGDRPVAVDTVVVSAQHAEDVSHEELSKDLKERIIRPVIPGELLNGTPATEAGRPLMACVPPDATELVDADAPGARPASVLAVQGAAGRAQIVVDIGAPLTLETSIKRVRSGDLRAGAAVHVRIDEERVVWL